jgi:hypothetical protein
MRGYFTFMYIDCYPRWPLGPMMDGYINGSKISTITLRTRSSPDRTKLYLRWKDQAFVAIGFDLPWRLLRELWHSALDLVPCHEQNEGHRLDKCSIIISFTYLPKLSKPFAGPAPCIVQFTAEVSWLQLTPVGSS